MCRRHYHGEAAPKNTETWEEKAGSNSCEDHVCRHFTDEVGDEKCKHNDRVLVANQIEIVFEASSLRISVLLPAFGLMFT